MTTSLLRNTQGFSGLGFGPENKTAAITSISLRSHIAIVNILSNFRSYGRPYFFSSVGGAAPAKGVSYCDIVARDHEKKRGVREQMQKQNLEAAREEQPPTKPTKSTGI